MDKKKVIVFAWDIAHNPVGRAFLFIETLKHKYDVTLIGPMFPHHGNELWFPLQNKIDNYISFKGSNFPYLHNKFKQLTKDLNPDFIIACKTRISSILPALILKEKLNIPIFIDIDDCELSLARVKNGIDFETLSKNINSKDIYRPYGKIWTQYCETLVNDFDGVIVSNTELQKRYGGTVIGHVRDEDVFFQKNELRNKTRKELGYKTNDKVVIFAGTPRKHKGIIEIAKALKKLNNNNYHLLVIGSFVEEKSRKELLSLKLKNLRLINNIPFEELPKHLGAADLMCILQNPDSNISKYQIPAKITDAFSCGIQLITTDVLPIRSLQNKGFIFDIIKSINELPQKIDQIFNQTNENTKEIIKENYNTFLKELSYKKATNELESLFNKTKPTQTIYAKKTIKFIEEQLNPEKNIVFFWKQNDSDIYGRRQDMILEHLSKRPEVNKIIHIDSPISHKKLFKIKNTNEQGEKIFLNTKKRFHKLNDTPTVKKRTFIYKDTNFSHSQKEILNTGYLPSKSHYLKSVKNWMKEEGINERSAIFWFCPIIPNLNLILKKFQPYKIITDVIDDQRSWASNQKQLDEMNKSYALNFKHSDIIITNSVNTSKNIKEFGYQSIIISNGAKKIKSHEFESFKKPIELKKLKGKLIGYVGNLDPKRLDLNLIEKIAYKFPNDHLVFIGSTHMGKTIENLAKSHSNIHLLGIKTFPEVNNYINFFDICLIPHLDNNMTQNMNPLKLYCYASLGKPIISTKLSGLDINYKGLFIKSNHSLFIQEISNIFSSVKTHYTLDNEFTWNGKLNIIFEKLYLAPPIRSYKKRRNLKYYLQKIGLSK